MKLSLYTAKETINKARRQTTEYQQTLASYTSNINFYHIQRTEKLNNKPPHLPRNRWDAELEDRPFSREETSGQ